MGASADPRRKTANARSCKTLESMQKELSKIGFQCCKTATYYKLLPRNRDTIEGNRHVITVLVKFCRAQFNLRKEHLDQQFCAVTIRSFESLASILGPEEIIGFFSSRQSAGANRDYSCEIMMVFITNKSKQKSLTLRVNVMIIK